MSVKQYREALDAFKEAEAGINADGLGYGEVRNGSQLTPLGWALDGGHR